MFDTFNVVKVCKTIVQRVYFEYMFSLNFNNTNGVSMIYVIHKN
jgi:hypothetical protein